LGGTWALFDKRYSRLARRERLRTRGVFAADGTSSGGSLATKEAQTANG